MEIYYGNIAYSKSKTELVCHKNSYIVVDNGKVISIFDKLPVEYQKYQIIDYKDSIIIPAFSDLHVHAPQYPNRGIAMDELLYDWLNKYTFPLESKYKDPIFAKEVYEKFIEDLLRHGTMHASIYATIHNEATDILINLLEEKGIRSFVGKVNMDKDSPDYLIEDTLESIKNTEIFIKKHQNNLYAKPIITPRFAPTCSFELLKKLGELGKKYNCGTQTHIVESLWEREEAKKCYPGCTSDMRIYERADLINKPFIAGHFIFPSEEDIEILKKYDGYAVQCPNATVNVIAGIMRTGYLLDNDINLSYGSDISAGEYLGIYRGISDSIRLSKIKSFYENDDRSITFKEAFYIATKKSGEIFGNVGSFEEGYEFDALVINNMSDSFIDLSIEEMLERFCYLGETKDITHRYLRGKEIII